MQISFTLTASEMVDKVASSGEMHDLARAIIDAGYSDAIVKEMDADDILGDLDEDEVKDWVSNNLSRSDLFDDDDILDEMDHGDIIDYVRTHIDDSRILDLLDGMDASDILEYVEDDDIKDYVQNKELLPAGNTTSDSALLAEVQRRLTDGSMEADDVLDILTQSGRLVIRTVYHTK